MKRNGFVLFLQYSGVSGLFILVIYPVLHEVGHILGALLFGGEIVAVSYLPTPSIICSFVALTGLQNALISFAGLLLPIIIFVIMPSGKSRSPIMNFGTFLFEIVIECSLIFSLINCIFPLNKNDDIAKIISGERFVAFVLLTGIVLMLLIVFVVGVKKKTHLSLKQLQEI